MICHCDKNKDVSKTSNSNLEALCHGVHACVDELSQVRTHLGNRLNSDLLFILRNHFCTLFVLQSSSNPGPLDHCVEWEGDDVVDKDDGLEDAEHPVPDEAHLVFNCSQLTGAPFVRTSAAHWPVSMGSGRESRLLSSYNFPAANRLPSFLLRLAPGLQVPSLAPGLPLPSSEFKFRQL